jgi:hypothetical protein
MVPILSQINPVLTIPIYCSNIRFNIIFYPKFSLYLFLLRQYPIRIPHFSRARYMPCPSRPPLLGLSN